MFIYIYIYIYISAGPLGHQAVELPLKSFLYMFLIHQAFQPPVFCLILQSSVLQSSILQCSSSYSPVLQYPSKRYCRLSARPPLAKNQRDLGFPPVPSRPEGQPNLQFFEDSLFGASGGSSWRSWSPFCRIKI